MSTHKSSTVTESKIVRNKELTISFSKENVTVEVAKYVEDRLITSYLVAQRRASEILLEESYDKKYITIEIPFLLNVNLGDLVNIQNIVYVIKRLSYKPIVGGVVLSIGAFKYE